MSGLDDDRARDLGRAVLAALAAVTPPGAVDELVALDACGLEHSAVRRLVRSGRLRTARIGRRRYVRKSEVLACFDALAVEQAAKAEPAKAGGYSSIVALAARRRAS